MVRTIMLGVVGFLKPKSVTVQVATLPKLVIPENNTEVFDAQCDFYEAQRVLRQAEANFNAAQGDFINIAIDEMNIARHRSDAATRKLRALLGLPQTSADTMEEVKARIFK